MPSPKEIANIENEGYKATQEYLASCTVCITGTYETFEHGTGVAVSFRGKRYILTAGHNIEDEPDDNKILMIGRANAPLADVPKDKLSEAVFKGSYGKPLFNPACTVKIIKRIVPKSDELDFAALQLADSEKSLPITFFHDISAQPNPEIVEGRYVNICGLPGEIAQQVENRFTGQRGAAGFLYYEQREILAITKVPENISSDGYFVVEYSKDSKTCLPKGMSGCGAWSIPKFGKETVWSAAQSQLLGIQSSHLPMSNLLKFVRLDRIVEILESRA